MMEHCRMRDLEPFLTTDELKATMEFKGALRETTRLTTVCQNEEKLNLHVVPQCTKIYTIVCQVILLV